MMTRDWRDVSVNQEMPVTEMPAKHQKLGRKEKGSSTDSRGVHLFNTFTSEL